MGNRTTKSTSKNAVISLGDYRYSEEASHRLVQQNGLGEGGPSSSGAMWRGWRASDKQAVSVKKMAASDLANQEIDSMLSVDHANILKLLDVHVQAPYVYVISEFCTCDLDEFLSAVKGQIDWRDQLPVLARNLAHGYYALYEKRILHRNINPHTIVVAHQGTDISFKLSGFEYSKRTNVDGVTNTVVTVNLDPYKAPEMGAAIVAERALSYDHRIDIWSLGAVLYRCAVGRTPYTLTLVAKLFFTLATASPRLQNEITGIGANLQDFELRFPSDVPPKLTRLLKSMLEITFSRRMTAEEFLYNDYVTAGDAPTVVPSRRGHGFNQVGAESPRDSFSLRTKQVENIGRHTLKRRKQLADERRLRDLEYASGPELLDAYGLSERQRGFDGDDHYSTLRHDDDAENDATLRQPAVLLPPPLPPRKKLSAVNVNGSIGAIEDNNSDTGSVGSQTLLAEGMNILSEPATIRSVESDVSMGTRREAKDDDEVPETDLDNGQPVRTIVVGQYEYQEDPRSFLGRGSFGSVWSGHDKDTGEPVAIKALTFLAGAEREIKILRSVNNPNILRFLYAHKISNTLYMVTELCRCDLKEFLDASPNGRLQNSDVQKVARDLAAGYRALHTARVLHRDIKPKNILLAQSGDKNRPHEFILKLADFGCGRFRDSSQCGSSPMTNGAMGTIDYMAPEVGARQMNPESRYDARADIWSIGVVLHECACGQLPIKRMDLYRLSMSVASNGRQADSRLDTSTFLRGTAGEEHPEEFKQLLCAMLQPLFQMRLTPDDFFRHPYVNQSATGGLRLATSRPRASLALVQHI